MTGGWVLGIDEAGRGPVLGPMVYASCYVKSADLPRLKTDLPKELTDSKQLSLDMREKIFTQMQKCSDWLRYGVSVIQARDISQGMARKDGKVSLNVMSHDAALSLVQQALDDGVQLDGIFVDTVGDPDKYADKFKRRFGSRAGDVVVSKKADALYKIVSAASVVAKVTRDRAMSGLEGAGSGYPGDPMTKAWLVDNLDHVYGYNDEWVRFSWGTITELLKKRAVKVEWEADMDTQEKMARECFSIETFFAAKKSASSDIEEGSGALTEPSTKKRRTHGGFLGTIGLERVSTL